MVLAVICLIISRPSFTWCWLSSTLYFTTIKFCDVGCHLLYTPSPNVDGVLAIIYFLYFFTSPFFYGVLDVIYCILLNPFIWWC